MPAPEPVLGEPVCFPDEAPIVLAMPRAGTDERGCATFDVEGGGTTRCSAMPMRVVSVSAPSELDVDSIELTVTLLGFTPEASRTIALEMIDPSSCECASGGFLAMLAEPGHSTSFDLGIEPEAAPVVVFGLSNVGALWRVHACFTVRS